MDRRSWGPTDYGPFGPRHVAGRPPSRHHGAGISGTGRGYDRTCGRHSGAAYRPECVGARPPPLAESPRRPVSKSSATSRAGWVPAPLGARYHRVRKERCCCRTSAATVNPPNPLLPTSRPSPRPETAAAASGHLALFAVQPLAPAVDLRTRYGWLKGTITTVESKRRYTYLRFGNNLGFSKRWAKD